MSPKASRDGEPENSERQRLRHLGLPPRSVLIVIFDLKLMCWGKCELDCPITGVAWMPKEMYCKAALEVVGESPREAGLCIRVHELCVGLVAKRANDMLGIQVPHVNNNSNNTPQGSIKSIKLSTYIATNMDGSAARLSQHAIIAAERHYEDK